MYQYVIYMLASTCFTYSQLLFVCLFVCSDELLQTLLMSLFLFFSGQEAPVQELADSIFARRIASTIEQKQVMNDIHFSVLQTSFSRTFT
jgi:hypothetical protein